MNSNRSTSSGGSKKIDINHYTKLLLEKKLRIILITIIISILWYFIYPIFLDKDKQYFFWAVIRFDDPRITQSATGVDERFTFVDPESKTRIINTTGFLTQIIDSLQLNVLSRTRGLSRENLFSDIRLDKEKLKFGKYKFHKNGKQIDILYTNSKEGKEDFLIDTFVLKNDSIISLDIQGIHANVYTTVFNHYDDIEFACINDQFIIGLLKSSIALELNRRWTLLTISFHHTDPLLGTKITNTIADLFLKHSLEFKRSRTKSAMEALAEQLKSSKEELEKVEDELKNFREQNPNIYLTEDLASYNQNLTNNEVELNQRNNNLARLDQLILEKDNVKSMNDRVLVYQEILTFLQEQGVIGIAALNQQYSTLINQRNNLIEQGFSEENPRIADLNSNLNSQHQTIEERIQQYKNNQNDRISNLQSSINNAERYLRQSPRKELELAKLQRDRNSKAQVYSSILLRYNEIKTTHASITPDVFLLERAQVPIIYSTSLERIIKLAKLMIGPVLGLILGIGLFIGIDFIWHKARSVDDIEDQLKLPVLAVIPVLKSADKIEKFIEAGKRMDPLLVTIDYTPSMGADAFRNLRTKLILELGKEEHYQTVITSLMPNEGKSLVSSNLAITFAQLKKQTLLIDTDMRRGVIHNSFLCNKKPGLADLLARGIEITKESLIQVIQRTTIPNLYLLTSGSSMPNPTELLIGDKIEKTLQILQKQFHYIIIDSPPIEFIPDAFVINQFVQNMLIVTRNAETNLNALKKKLKEYEKMKNTIKGLVFNGSNDMSEKKYQSYSYYKY